MTSVMMRGLEYIQATNGNVTQAIFKEDWSPVGGIMWEDLIKAEYIEEKQGVPGASGYTEITEAGYEAMKEERARGR